MSLQPTAIACHKPWDQVTTDLATDPARGLPASVAAVRLAQHGTNELAIADQDPWWHKLLEQFQNPLIYLLLGSALVSSLVGEWDNAISITLAIVIVATVAFVQEYKSEQSLQALNTLVPHYANVIRDGQALRVNAKELVPGDICTFSTGDRISADVRLIEAFDLQLDESTLTGETKPVRKTTDPIERGHGTTLPVAERKNVCYMGTLVKNGHGTGVVVGTSKSTEFGAIFLLMHDVEVKKTPLQQRMDELGQHLSLFSSVIILIILLIGWGLQGKSLLEIGLPVVVTVTLALGVLRLAERKAIVKRLPSIETLSCVNVLCVDKTGTLTTNQMTAAHIWTRSRLKPVAARRLAMCAVLCNNTRVDATGQLLGQATDTALFTLGARTLGLGDVRTGGTLMGEEPFSSDTKCMVSEWVVPGSAASRSASPSRAHSAYAHSSPSQATLGLPPSPTSPTRPSGARFYMKGALEPVLAACPGTDPRVREAVVAHARTLASEGLRVIALASGSMRHNLTFLGLVSIHDPPRPNVHAVIRRLQHSGVRVLMMTGDSDTTATAIARQVGILGADQTLSGAQVANGELVDLNAVGVFYRMSPAHKLDVVRALQGMGCVVSMIGDGVNDAPALRLAEIGVSMGMAGTDVSKEAADMILVDDELGTLVTAIEEGKAIFHNIRNFLSFQLSTSISALSLVAIATFMGLPNPLNAMQILWINIIMDGPPAQSLGVEPVDRDAVENTGPRPSSAPIITRQLIAKVLTSALVIVTGTLITYSSELASGRSNEHVTTMTFTMFVMYDMFNALSCRSLTKSIWHLGLFTNRMFNWSVGFSIVGHLCVVYVPVFQSIFQTGHVPRLVGRVWPGLVGKRRGSGATYNPLEMMSL
ncbi:hypothetical protein BCR44DRAFT_1435029 [Catenaria anguillulae PL171]|uniref:Cation-transporting P-type ATPase N-terminal domain-containing protein n=1 Tax=Catenaria anguillulae PL171 TaxID=765915 RepID=A0A1Y2HM79_9FUNG|nr:hypothetical protein BCR44DRAFT_1435029 [Catenaria anguillulae PL171]